MKTIRFKSTPDNWEKEYLRIKSNTVRVFDENDIRLEITQDYLLGKINLISIEIENTETGETFTEKIKDITLFHIGNREVYIYSW